MRSDATDYDEDNTGVTEDVFVEQVPQQLLGDGLADKIIQGGAKIYEIYCPGRKIA